MGLNAYAYRTVELVHRGRPTSDEEWDELEYLSNAKGFEARGDGFEDGTFVASGGELDWAGAYSSYNTLRREVCRLATGLEPETIWRDVPEEGGAPLWRWVNFSDCEGFLGPWTCALLARQAAVHGDRVAEGLLRLPENGQWLAQGWTRWREMFTLAAGSGVIVYA